MATETTNLGLVKPDPQELYDISVANGNMDIVDDNVGVTFCTSTTRPPSPKPRRIIFETDTLKAFGWTGTDWIQIADLGVAGAVLESIVNAKGDLLVGTADNVVGRFGVGANGSQIIADSTVAAGMRWSNNPPMKVVNLPDQASIPLDPTAGKLFKLTATGNRTIQAPAVGIDGCEIIIAHTASGGTRTLALTQGSAGAFELSGSTTTLNSTASGETDYIRAIYHAGSARWHASYVMEAM